MTLRPRHSSGEPPSRICLLFSHHTLLHLRFASIVGLISPRCARLTLMTLVQCYPPVPQAVDTNLRAAALVHTPLVDCLNALVDCVEDDSSVRAVNTALLMHTRSEDARVRARIRIAMNGNGDVELRGTRALGRPGISSSPCRDTEAHLWAAADRRGRARPGPCSTASPDNYLWRHPEHALAIRRALSPFGSGAHQSICHQSCADPGRSLH